MDFFEHQDRARRKTGVLLAYFALAVLGIVLAVNAAVYGLLVYSGQILPEKVDWLARPWWLGVTALTLLVIGGGSLVRSWQLREGGVALNQMLGARPVLPTTSDADERRLINVVEEMAIASGLPVPRLFLMDGESGINAFVAGYTPASATLTVTRGTLQQLSRDELQGVVGHEFSHILNADMRINLRLIGILAGILALGQLGEFMLRGSNTGGLRLGARGRGNSGAVLGFGLALTVIGWLGLFFGRLIKAAISRQREFLADASSVQFTRNPDGIAGALAQIERHAGGALLANSHAEEMSHLCFGLSVPLSAWFATHPPIAERIKAIKGRYVAPRAPKAAAATTAGPGAEPASGFAPMAPAAAVASIGSAGPEHVGYAERMLQELPAALRDTDRDAEQAIALVYALLVPESGNAEEALSLLARRESPERVARVRALVALLAAQDARSRLPLLELALPALGELGAEDRQQLRTLVQILAARDGRFRLFECALQLLVERSLGLIPASRGPIRSFGPVLSELALVFALLCEHANSRPEARQALYGRIMAGFSLTPPPRPSARPEAFAAALRKLADLTPLLKRAVIQACADCVLHDEKLRLPEYEALRAVCAALDCPLPPCLAAR